MLRRLFSWVVAVLGIILAASPSTYAASVPGKIGMEMVVLLPSHGKLAVFEQVDMSTLTPNPVIGIIPHAEGLEGVGDGIIKTSGNYVVMNGTPKQFAIKYDVGWNGKSANLLLPAYLATNALVILAPSDLSLPEVLNPSLVPAGKGKLPGIPNSPLFYEYATSNLQAGQGFQAVIESKVIAQSSNALLLPSGGSYPVVGSIFQALLVILGLGGIFIGMNWRPLSQYSRRQAIRDQLLSELAVLEASHRRGEVAENAYETIRQELLVNLSTVWDVHESRVG
ncbi:MAG: hypothetical protein ACYCT0_04670 [Sulfobacillus sp.]